MIEIPKNIKNAICDNNSIIAAIDCEEVVRKYYGGRGFKDAQITKFICSCSPNEIQDYSKNTEITENTNNIKCKHCGNISWNPQLMSSIYIKNYLKMGKSFYCDKINNKRKGDNSIYIKMSSDNNSIECFVGYPLIELIENDGDPYIKKTAVITNYMKYTPGKPVYAIKVLKRSNKEVTPFEVFNINSNTRWNQNCIYEDYNNFFEFMDKNKDFIKRCGMFNAMKYVFAITNNSYYYSHYSVDSFFIIYLALVSEYPILEQLIKMGYTKLYFDIFNDVISSSSKTEITRKVNRLNKLLNNTTKGSLALRIPQYIGTYLKDKSANLQEYLDWCDIYEQDNISKENFEKIIDSNAYIACLNSGSIGKIADIMKYGYGLNELLKFLYKDAKKTNSNSHLRYRCDSRDPYSRLSNNTNLLRDYLEMCDLLEITPDKTPMDIQKVHDEVSALVQVKETEIYNVKIESLGKTAEKYFQKNDNDKTTKMEDKYEIIFPKSTKDLVDEGQQQHNCVGGYYRSIVQGNCVIFFIRKKESPKESYITAEYRNSGNLGQVMYKNNVRVTDGDMINWCKVICNKLKKGLLSGQIEKCA